VFKKEIKRKFKKASISNVKNFPPSVAQLRQNLFDERQSVSPSNQIQMVVTIVQKQAHFVYSGCKYLQQFR